jgi:hypothetical protein
VICTVLWPSQRLTCSSWVWRSFVNWTWPDHLQTGKEGPFADHDGARCHSIDASRPCPPIAPHPIPRNREEGGIGDQVEQVIEPTMRVADRPLVHLGLDLQYPPLGLIEVGPRRVGIDEAEDELVEVVDFLKNPQRYTKLGARVPRGVLL